jgi:Family of unknown function (DUF6600)
VQVPPPSYQPPSQPETPPPTESYRPPERTSYAPPPAPAYTPPPETGYRPPPPPVYAPPEQNGTYVNIEVAPPADPAPSVDVFFDALAPYGRWENDPSFGRVWIPSNPRYEPYHDGYWQVTDYGFTWISNEPFGWAVCHYGRWIWRGVWMWTPEHRVGTSLGRLA